MCARPDVPACITHADVSGEHETKKYLRPQDIKKDSLPQWGYSWNLTLEHELPGNSSCSYFTPAVVTSGKYNILLFAWTIFRQFSFAASVRRARTG